VLQDPVEKVKWGTDIIVFVLPALSETIYCLAARTKSVAVEASCLGVAVVCKTVYRVWPPFEFQKLETRVGQFPVGRIGFS
jgi:hypothetical protein